MSSLSSDRSPQTASQPRPLPVPLLRHVPFWVKLSFWLVVPICLVWIPYATPALTFWWDWANALGYFAFGLIILLFFLRGQSVPGLAGNGRHHLQLHQWLGYLTLGLATAHLVILLLHEPLLIEHLKLTAPAYMLAGLLAFVCLLVLMVSALTGARRRLWPDYRRFRYWHAAIALMLILLALWHVLGSAYYAAHWAEQSALLALCFSALLAWKLSWPLAAKVDARSAQRASGKPLLIKCTLAWLMASLALALLVRWL